MVRAITRGSAVGAAGLGALLAAATSVALAANPAVSIDDATTCMDGSEFC